MIISYLNNVKDTLNSLGQVTKYAYYAQLSANYANANPNRVMTTVTLEMSNGRQVMSECIGAFPVVEPEPTPEPEEEPTLEE